MSSSTVSELRREISGGKITIKLSLAADEISAPQEPPPLYFTVPRLGYLPSVADRALDAFRNVLSPLALVNPRASGSGSGGAREEKTAAEASTSSPSPSSPSPWFSETGDPSANPVRWHFPIGVLADAALARRGKRESKGRGRGGGNEDGKSHYSSSSSSPWPLTIHFSRYPASVLPPWRAAAAATAASGGETTGKRTSSAAASAASSTSISSPALREAFFNSLKEASCAATGSAARVLAMPSTVAERLWVAAEAGDAEAASAIVSRTFAGGGGGGGDDDDDKESPFPSSPSSSVPLRLVVVAPAAGESLRDPECAFEVVCTSRPVAKSRRRGGEGGEGEKVEEKEEEKEEVKTTLGQALLEALPKLAAAKETPAWTLDESGGLSLRGKSAKVLIAGLEVGGGARATAAGGAENQLLLLLAAPLLWCHARLSACDQFLYVVVRALEPL